MVQQQPWRGSLTQRPVNQRLDPSCEISCFFSSFLLVFTARKGQLYHGMDDRYKYFWTPSSGKTIEEYVKTVSHHTPRFPPVYQYQV